MDPRASPASAGGSLVPSVAPGGMEPGGDSGSPRGEELPGSLDTGGSSRDETEG